MAWDSKYSNFGVVKIERKNVKVFSDQNDYITIGLVDEVTNAIWVDDELNITLKSGEVRRYSDRNYFITI
ncbi:MAG: hypothetical protein NTX43_12875 [Bacteroidetes bacterium]|nr:hypothetical protein [Bacteroidota bacterium]